MVQNVIVKKINKKGRGVFAAKNFKKGELIINIRGKAITKSKLFSSSDYFNDHSSTIGKNKYLILGYPERYINHSCEPNVFEYKRKIIAIKNIRKEEEITFDYSICSIDDWRMKCHCGSKTCRKIVRGDFFKLPQRLQITYLPYLDEWFKKEFKKQIGHLKTTLRQNS